MFKHATRHKRAFPKIPVLLCFVVIVVAVLTYRAYRMSPTGVSSSISDIVTGSILQDAVPAIDHPKFESVSVADQYLNNDGLGIRIDVNHRARFYPYQILVWHHVVNDVLDSQALLIAYNPFAMSGAVYQRSIQGIVYDFGLSDKIADSNLLLYDRTTHSLWDPMKHEAIDGDRKGTILMRYPSSVMSWNTFKQTYSTGEVLSRETGYSRDYTHDPYGDYKQDASVLFPVAHKDDRLSSKALVYGIEWNEKQKVYPVAVLEKQSMIADVIDTTRISVERNEKTGLVRAFQVDASGTHQTEIPVTESYWFAWANAFPETQLFK